MLRKAFVAAVTGALIFSASSHALAQQPSLADRETARSLMDEGDKKRDTGDLKGALKSYEAADAIMKVPTTGIEVARTQIALLQLLEARETLGRILRSPAKSNEPAPFAAARKAADALNTELVTRIPSVQVVLQNADSGPPPQISVDGEPVPAAATNVPRKVNPGAHTVGVKAGSFEKKVEVNVVERETKTVTVDLKEKTAEFVRPRAPVRRDEVTPEKSNAIPKVLVFGGFGLAAVGIGVGAVTGVMSMSKTSELKDVCRDNRCPPEKQGDIDSATGLGDIATAAFIVGGVGLGAGIVGLVMSGRKKEPPASVAHTTSASPFTSQHVRAVLGPSYVGLAGAF